MRLIFKRNFKETSSTINISFEKGQLYPYIPFMGIRQLPTVPQKNIINDDQERMS